MLHNIIISRRTLIVTSVIFAVTDILGVTYFRCCFGIGKVDLTFFSKFRCMHFSRVALYQYNRTYAGILTGLSPGPSVGLFV